MMKKCKKINYFLTMALLAVVFPAFAVDVTQQDIGKTAGKASDQVQKAKENYHQTMERISQNQYTTAVGDGIKSAKEGMAWAQSKMSAAMNTISAVQNDIFNSTEAKILMLTQQIATAKKMISTMESMKKEQLAQIDADLKVEQAALEEKIKLSQENIETSEAVYEQELNDAKTEEEKEKIKEEIEALRQGGSVEQAEFEEAAKALEDDAEAQKKSIAEEYDNQIYTQKEQVSDLTKQYEDLIMQASVSEGQTEQNPTQIIEESMKDFSFTKEEKVSLQDRKDKERSRKRRLTTASISAFNTSSQNAASIDALQSQQKIISDLGESMTGQSEAVESSIKSTVNQLEGLYDFLLTELKALEAETAIILSKSTIEVDGANPNTDICKYSGKRGGILGAMDALQSVQGTAMGAMSAAQGTVTNAASVVSTATETMSTATSTANGMINDSKAGIGMH